ncbi:MAG: GlsB/YeaQ/YmgE family stress response membrane protein [Candidatus Methanoperedenaceae archaeon]|nr:MAG: GlsB/YeaQ/YmgE family stress response membrane protein [Candidatus Methanoperedenaceae archaeon]
MIIAIVVGLIAGWLAGIIMKGSGYGIIGDIILGILGSIIGNWIFGFLGIGSYGILWTIIVAVIGAVVLIYMVRFIRNL